MPNIVFILADDFGYNDIGYHAVEQDSAMATPYLDSLVQDSVRLENYYVQPICTPSRSQLMTGRYQIHTGLQNGVILPMQPNAVPIDNILLPEQLRQCWYDTHMVGKWHLGFYKKEFLPWNRGFNTFFGYLTGCENYFTHTNCFKVNNKTQFCGVDMGSEIGPTNTSFGTYSTNLFADKAVDIIHNTDPLKPMFLYLAFQAVHSPLQVPQPYVEPFSYIKNEKRRIYLGMVRAMDEAILNISTHLKNAGRWNNTILIFSTDNGGQVHRGGNNWPLRGSKGTHWEGGIRGVGFVHSTLPNMAIRKGINRKLVHISDWYPTILSAAKCPLINGTQPLDGVNQWKTISKNTKSNRSEFLININPFGILNRTMRMGFDISSFSGIRVGDWKLLTGVNTGGNWYKPPEWSNIAGQADELQKYVGPYANETLVKLFNIALDPYERTDLSAQYPDIVDRLLVKLTEYNETAVPVRYPPLDPKSDPSLHNGFWGPWR